MVLWFAGTVSLSQVHRIVRFGRTLGTRTRGLRRVEVALTVLSRQLSLSSFAETFRYYSALLVSGCWFFALLPTVVPFACFTQTMPRTV